MTKTTITKVGMYVYDQWGRNEIFLGEDLFNKKILKLQFFS